MNKEIEEHYLIICKHCYSTDVTVDYDPGYTSSDCADLGSLVIKCNTCGGTLEVD